MNHSWIEMIIKEGALSRFSSTVVGLTVWYKRGEKQKEYYLPGEAVIVLQYLYFTKYFL